MKEKSRVSFLLISSLFIFFLLSGLASGQANVSRSPNWRSTSPRIVVDPAGNLHVAYSEVYREESATAAGTGDAFYCKYDNATNEWGTPVNLSNNSQVYSPEYRTVGIAIDGSQRLYFVYVQRTRIMLRIFSAGSWSSPSEVATSGSDCDSARVAVDNDGNIFVCWWVMGAYRVLSRARVSGNWESVKQLSPSGSGSKFPDIAVGDNVAFCVWTGKETVSPYRYKIWYTRRGKGFDAAWTAAAQAAPDDLGQQVPAVEIDSSNVAHLVFTPKLASGGLRKVQYCRWTGSRFTSPLDISPQGLLHYPALHERGGNLYASWQTGAYRNGTAIRYNNRINGAWTGVGSVPNSGNSTYSDVATNPSQSEVYYVWDGGDPEEILCNMGQTGPPPPPPPPPTGEPVADFVFSPSSGTIPLTVNFDASLSQDPDGNIVSYSWTFGDGGTGSGRTVSHTYTRAGVFTIRLTVTDNDGKTDSTSRTLDISQPNDSPIANFSFSPETGVAPVRITFDASASRDPDGTISQYNWDFGDGGRGSGRVVGHTYQRSGTFTVRLTVTDNRGAIGTRSRTLEIRRLYPPLNVSWQTHIDQSLFQTRYVTQIAWERNPSNDSIGAQIILHRIYRKKKEIGAAYQRIGEVGGDVYVFLDKDVGGADLYTYAVTVVDNQGRESPTAASDGPFVPLLKESRLVEKKSGQVKRF